jgi:quercetin dioxygenase-like cupin family protein
MSRFLRLLMPVLGLSLVEIAASTASAQTKSESVAALSPRVRFEGDVAVQTKAGASRMMRVVLRDWTIRGAQRIERFPEQGFAVVQLHSGNLTTTINGKQEKRSGGDFWTIPAGATMSVQVTSESAVLQTMVIQAGGR